MSATVSLFWAWTLGHGTNYVPSRSFFVSFSSFFVFASCDCVAYLRQIYATDWPAATAAAAVGLGLVILFACQAFGEGLFLHCSRFSWKKEKKKSLKDIIRHYERCWGSWAEDWGQHCLDKRTVRQESNCKQNPGEDVSQKKNLSLKERKISTTV